MELSRQEYWSGLPFPSPPKEINITFVARWATGHRNVPIKINHLRPPAINAISWDTGQPHAPQSKGTEDQRLLLRLPKTEEGPSSWPQYNRFTSLEWSQEHKWMWQVVNHFLTQLGGHLFVLTSFSGPFSS